MPNWTFCTINANDEVINKYINGEGHFDFNLIIPRPTELEVDSGSIVDESVTYYLTERLTLSAKEVNLNYYINSFYSHLEGIISMDSEVSKVTIDRLKNHLKEMSEAEKNELYNKGAMYVSNLRKYGHYTWYSWSFDNWGTKWNAKCTYKSEGSVEFNTAWNIPDKIFEKICEDNPEESIEFLWENEDWDGYWRAENVHGKVDNVTCDDGDEAQKSHYGED